MKMKATEIRKMSAAELESKLGDLKKDLFQLRLQHATNQLDNPVKIAEVKRDIARVKTSSVSSSSQADKKEERDHGEQNFFPQDQSRPGGFR